MRDECPAGTHCLLELCLLRLPAKHIAQASAVVIEIVLVYSGAAAIVSNHISYLDILVHMAHSFPSFVARGNTKDLPLVGLIR